MAMSRKHYVAVAANLAHIREYYEFSEGANAVHDMTIALADMFASDNPNFNRAKFYTAAGEDAE